jgi:hypothetical protein
VVHHARPRRSTRTGPPRRHLMGRTGKGVQHPSGIAADRTSPTLVASAAWRATATPSDRRRCLAGGRPAALLRPADGWTAICSVLRIRRRLSPARTNPEESGRSPDPTSAPPRHRSSAVVPRIDGCVFGVVGDRHCMSPRDLVVILSAARWCRARHGVAGGGGGTRSLERWHAFGSRPEGYSGAYQEVTMVMKDPAHPGEILREDLLTELGLSVARLLPGWGFPG